MANDPEALAQLARLLGDAALRAAPLEAVRAAIESRFDQLVDGLIDEATASDDVIDRESALIFLDARLRFFDALLSAEQRSRLRQALQAKIEAW